MPFLFTHGQEKIKALLEQHFTHNKLPHAQCFIDKEGRGGLSLAVDLALRLLHENEEDSTLTALLRHPDLHFVFPIATTSQVKSKPSCRDFLSEWQTFLINHLSGNVIDWLEHAGAENKQGNIPVEEINQLIPKMHLKPYLGKNKVCIFWGAERLGGASANKLLKLIEEPPANTYFIFVINDLAQLLPTIKSRCQITKLPPLSQKDLERFLIHQGIETNDAVTRAQLCDGNLRLAAKQLSNSSISQELEEMFVSCLRLAFQVKHKKSVGYELMEWANKAAAMGRPKQKAFFSFGLSLIRQAMMQSYQTATLIHFESNTDFSLQKFSKFIHAENIQDLVALCENALYAVERNAHSKILFADFCLELTRLLHRKETA